MNFDHHTAAFGSAHPSRGPVLSFAHYFQAPATYTGYVYFLSVLICREYSCPSKTSSDK